MRRALLRRAVLSGWDAISRQDFDLMLVRYAPDVELETAPDFEALGLGGTFRGHDGLRRVDQAFREAWERWEFRPATVLDLGDRLLALGTVRLPGTASGLELEREIAQLMTLRGGLVAREQDFLAWEAGLRAAGLDPDALALPALGHSRQGTHEAGTSGAPFS